MYSLFATIPQTLGNRKTTITSSPVRANHHGETTLPDLRVTGLDSPVKQPAYQLTVSRYY